MNGKCWREELNFLLIGQKLHILVEDVAEAECPKTKGSLCLEGSVFSIARITLNVEG